MFRIVLLFSALLASSSTFAAESGIDRLMEGNKRYVQDKLEHPNRGAERRSSLTSSQEPFAVILGCSDSRVAPEIIFDQGIGDLFVVRVAGNVIGALEFESIHYAAAHLHSSVILVLGHENCGAVKAVVQGETAGIEDIANLIDPAVREAKKLNPDHLLVAAIKENAIRMKDQLMKAPKLQKLIADKKLEVHAGYFHLDTGKVEILK